MKLLLDENLSPTLVPKLQSTYPGSIHVRDAQLGHTPDADIWDFALAHGFVIVSKDSDFEHRSLLSGGPPKVVHLQFGNCPTAVVLGRLLAHETDIAALACDPQEHLLVIR